MINELMRPSEFGPDAFDKFLGVARQSTVPDSFSISAAHVTARLAPELLDKTPTNSLPPSYLDIAQTLVERDFGTSELAYYALQYGLTVASFKRLDTFQSEVEPVRQQYNEKLRGYHQLLTRLATTRYNCPMNEVIERAEQDNIGINASTIQYYQHELSPLHSVLDKANPIEEQLRDNSGLAARWVLAMESAWLGENTTSVDEDTDGISWLRGAFNPTAEELKDVRTYMEVYFGDADHRSRIQTL